MVLIIFGLLVKFFVPKDDPAEKIKGITKITLELPREVVINHRPEMTLLEREKRRRRLLNDIFKIGFYSRECLEAKHRADKKLGDSLLK